MGWVDKQVEDAVDFVTQDIPSKIEDEIIEPTKELGSSIDDFVNEEIPGGWYTVAAATGAYFAPEIAAAMGAEAGAAGAATATEVAAAEFVAADAASLAAQGLTESQIASTLAASGVEGFVAADAAALASQGLSSQQIASGLSQSISGSSGYTTLATDFPTIGDQPGDYPMSGGYGNPTAEGVQQAAQNLLDYNAAYATGGVSVTDALRLANQANNLLNPQQQQQQLQGQMPALQQGGATTGAVDYSGLLGLLQTKAKRPDILNLLG
jgi:hypothetical protein